MLKKEESRPGTKILIELEMPAPPAPVQKQEPKERKPTIEEKVREALQCIESGHDSHEEWILINKIYKCLKKKKLSERGQNVVNMIEPVLAHYGYFGVSSDSAK